jgi:hypothetical protein
MYESLADRLRRWSRYFSAVFADQGARALWLLLFLGLFLLVVAFNASKALVFAWLAAKIIGAAVLAVALYHTWVRPDLDSLEGIERAMGETGRVTLMAAAIIAAAFTP